MELGKIHQHPLLKVGEVAKAVAHAFHCFYGVVNSINNTRREAMGKIVQYTILPVIERIEKFIQMLIVHSPSFFYPLIECDFTRFFSQMLIEN